MNPMPSMPRNDSIPIFVGAEMAPSLKIVALASIQETSFFLIITGFSKNSLLS
jgi:hypothetical protein